MMQRIFVGDVQGCGRELETLVKKAEAAFGSEFSLWVAGDLVNRGPDNRGPLECIRRLVEDGRGEYVLGNHEITLLQVGLGLRDLRPNDSIGDVLAGSDAGEWIEWLRQRPLVVRSELAGQAFAMLHASSDPDWDLDTLERWGAAVHAKLSGPLAEAAAFLDLEAAADEVRDALARITRGRSIDAAGHWSSEEPLVPEHAWHYAWSARGHDFGIVYGHWARQGLHIAQGLRGLDTGCVHHGRGRDGFLTAWLPEAPGSAAGAPGDARRGLRPFDVPDDRLWQIPAERRYYFPESELSENEEAPRGAA